MEALDGAAAGAPAADAGRGLPFWFARARASRAADTDWMPGGSEVAGEDPLDAALDDPLGEASVAGLAGEDAAGAGGADGVGGVGTTDDGMAAEDGEALDTSRDAAGVERDPERLPLGLGGGGGGADDGGVALDGDADDAEPLVVALRAAEAPRAEGSLPRGVTAGSAAPRPRRAACTLVA